MGKKYFAAIWLVTLIAVGCSSSKEITTTPSAPAPSAEPVAEEMPLDEPEADVLDYWVHLDGDDGAYVGIGTERAYASLLAGKKPEKKVVVAVIDSGVDIAHEDISVWMNEDEIAGNGVDDDKNGYVDDVNGWNFIGGADGENIYYDTFEVTREYARLKAVFEGADEASFSPAMREEFAYYEKIKSDFEAEVQEMSGIYTNLKGAIEALEIANSIIANALGASEFTIDEVRKVESAREDVQQAKSILLYFDEVGVDHKVLMKEINTFEGYLEKGLNPEFDPRGIVGDQYTNVAERHYGNNNVTGPDAFHGTHVAGIIGGKRGNGIGVDGIADHVAIMAVRAVPKGDERDKDIANAIRYAVDNGADIINMSFGKGVSPYKEAVDEAIRYADAEGVLMIHAAGNDNEDNDTTLHFPTPEFADGNSSAENWIEVGASSWEGAEKLAASFSNYGKESVDLFAPGVDIYSTVPGNEYDHADGTSMASPVVAGLAALIMSYYPQFSASQVKNILLHSATPYGDYIVQKPGSEEAMVAFSSLSRTGGIANAYAALKMAEKMAGK